MINDDNNAQATLADAFTGMRGLKQWLFRGMEQDAARKMPLLMTNSRYMTNVLAKAYQLPEERLPILYKSVDAAPLPYQPERVWPSGDAPWRILFVKTDFVRGGLQDLAEALRLLPQYRFAIEVAGPTEPFHPEITRYFAGLPHVTLTILGPQPQAVIRKKLYDAHIFCVPARMEALGVANMEAALAGTPIVSTTAGGIPEVLDEGRAAFLADPHTPTALATALERCITNSQERATKQAHARTYVAETFSKERMLRRFMELVKKGCTANYP
jgi:glycosyltransferase involved in cell wall biosynthesis